MLREEGKEREVDPRLLKYLGFKLTDITIIEDEETPDGE
jgi:hypothetical protein